MVGYYMEPLKPNAAFYLIPIFAFFGGIILGIYLIVSGATALGQQSAILEVGKVTTLSVDKPDVLLIFCDDADPSEVVINQVNLGVYRVFFGDDRYVDFTIMNTETHSELKIDYATGMEMNIENYVLCLKVEFPEAGSYYITTAYHYEPYTAPHVANLVTVYGFKAYMVKFITGIICFPIGFIIALVSFILIIVKRSSYKKMILKQYYQSQQKNVQPQNEY